MAASIDPPNYQRSLISLMAALAQGLGVEQIHYEPLPELPVERLRGRTVVLLVVDGLGLQLLRHLPATAPLRRHYTTPLQSVFPTTTAAAITTIATAAAPARHAVTGWFTWLKELGSVATLLPFRPRLGSAGYSGVTPQELVGATPLTARIALASAYFQPAEIAHSVYSRFVSGPAQQCGFHGLSGLFDGLAAAVQANAAPRYLFGYWSELDGLAHRFGSESAAVLEQLYAIDNAFGRFLETIAGSGALVLLTADHGLTDSLPERTVDLAAHPRLAAALTLPLCGEPRAAFAYLRPAQRAAFIHYVTQELAERCDLISAEQLLEERWFGPGPEDPRLTDRIGDYLLLPRDGVVFRQRLPHEAGYEQRGVHGGLSQAERTVPLIIAECG